jgi:hypothetical protein
MFEAGDPVWAIETVEADDSIDGTTLALLLRLARDPLKPGRLGSDDRRPPRSRIDAENTDRLLIRLVVRGT